MKAKILPILIFLIVFATLGYLREYFFVHINIIMHSKYYHRAPEPPLTGFITYFERFSYETLYYSKYIYTVLFTLSDFLISYFAIKRITQSPLLIKVLVYAYAFILLCAGLAMLVGYLGFNRLQDDEYTLSRWLMGIAQSPIICLILLASSTLIQKKYEQ